MGNPRAASPARGSENRDTNQNPEIGATQEAATKTAVKRPLMKPLNKKRVESYNEGLKKRGVVYMSRVPPFMKPAKVKHLMEQHGVVTRVSTETYGLAFTTVLLVDY